MTVLLGVSETVLDWDLFAYIQWSTAPCTFHWSNICLSMGEYETSVSLITSPLGDPCTCHLVFPPPELYINTRHNHNVHYCRTNLTLMQKGVFYSGCKVFNHLPENIKVLSHDLKHFKSALKSFLIVHTFYSLEEFYQIPSNWLRSNCLLRCIICWYLDMWL